MIIDRGVHCEVDVCVFVNSVYSFYSFTLWLVYVDNVLNLFVRVRTCLYISVDQMNTTWSFSTEVQKC